MSRPEIVVFDLGKVLVDFDYGIAARRIAEHGKVSPEEVRQCIDQSPLLLRYETGLMSRAGFFAEVQRATGFDASMELFAGYFADVFSPIDPMIALHAGLVEQGIPTCIFSNTNDLAVDHIRRSFPFFANFDAHVLSYEHGAMKPDDRLYEVVERVTGRSGPSILYLDDRLENVESGRARGWETIHHVSPGESIEKIRELGLLSRGSSNP